MIDEKKLMEIVNTDEWKYGIIRSSKTIQEALSETIESMPKVGEWIPCSERLPEDDKPVLIQYHDEEDEAIMFVGCYEYGYFNVWDERIFPDYEEVAWMPLPEPYKEEE